MAKTLLTSKGAPVVLGRELGKGGEGSVFEVPALHSQVAKLYHKTPDVKKQAKLGFMAATADAMLLNYVAWPQETLHLGRGGPVIGFLMPTVAGKDPIHMIYSPAHRRQDYPNAAWDFLLCVARNIAASFETVHAHGHVIGDVNQNSFLVGRDSKVVLIDSDSFQVNARGSLHLCEVGVSHFTPPELQSLSTFDGFARSTNHDNFGLALLIFHVLFGGRHPFSGVPLRNGIGDAIETDIKNFRYAYARDNQSRGFSPPPRSIPVSILPDAQEAMFQFAFTERGSSAARPTAQQWVAALDGLSRCLKKCGTSSMHVYPDHLAKCPWCTLEQQGIVYFVDLGATSAPTSSSFVLTQVWGLIQAVTAPPPVSVPSPNSFSAKARPLPAGMLGGGTSTTSNKLKVVVGISAMGFVILKSVIIAAQIELILVLTLALALVLVLVVGYSMAKAKRAAEKTKRRSALEMAGIEYDQLAELAQKEAGPEVFHARKAELSRLRGVLEDIPRAEKEEIDQLRSRALERQKQKFLGTCFLDKARISGVGSALKAALRSFGIETAADVTKNRVRQVPGFGESKTRAVLDWKASCERHFNYNSAASVSEPDRNAVRAKYATKRVALERSLADGPAQLHEIREKAQVQLASLQPQLEFAAYKLAQAQADYSLLR